MEEAAPVTMRIEGMMCEHCENAVKSALEGVGGVLSARADAAAGTAVITMEPGTDLEALKEAVTRSGYVFKEFIS